MMCLRAPPQGTPDDIQERGGLVPTYNVTAFGLCMVYSIQCRVHTLESTFLERRTPTGKK